jgi:hypothetical protein
MQEPDIYKINSENKLIYNLVEPRAQIRRNKVVNLVNEII